VADAGVKNWVCSNKKLEIKQLIEEDAAVKNR